MKKKVSFVLSLLLMLNLLFPAGAVRAFADEMSVSAESMLAETAPQVRREETTSTTRADDTQDANASGTQNMTSSGVPDTNASQDTNPSQDAADTSDEQAASAASSQDAVQSAAASKSDAPQDIASVTSENPSNSNPMDASSAQVLQQMVDDAVDGGTVKVTRDMTLDTTITIPQGKTITLTDDGSAHTLTSTAEPMFKVEGTLIIDASSDANLVLKGVANDMEAQGAIATVTGKLVLRAGTLTGGKASGVYEGTVVVNGATFDMVGGKITGEQEAKYSRLSTATVIIKADAAGKGSTFNLSGGSITDNQPMSKVAVLLAKSVMNMTGGSIDHNSGGVVASFSSTFNLSGGSIANNKTTGVYLNAGTSFNMKGGTISGNHSIGTSGGGIWATDTEGLNIQGGHIVDNIADVLGGGIYIDSNVSVACIANVLVAENTATLMGGGVWCCPTSNANINVTDGMAIFDNKTSGSSAAGDDFANLDQSETEGAVVSISRRMLGGGLNALYRDGEISYNANGKGFWGTWGVNSTAARFDAANPGEMQGVDGTRISRALKSMPSEAAKAAARAEATTIISGNTAKAGGGIATNGGFISGEHDEWQLSIKKAWDKDISLEDRSAVPVYIMVDGVAIDHVVLSADNNWHATLEGLPNPQTLGSVELLEGSMDAEGNPTATEPTNRWQISYSAIQQDTGAKTMSATVTNAPIPEEPKDDKTPPQEHHNKQHHKHHKKQHHKRLPQTGDSNQILTPLVLLAVGVGAVALYVVVKKRHENK